MVFKNVGVSELFAGTGMSVWSQERTPDLSMQVLAALVQEEKLDKSTQ